jgi:succinate dehydrogenase hydrophobic anchor subunit
MFYNTRRFIYLSKEAFKKFKAYLQDSTYTFELSKELNHFFSFNSYSFFFVLFFTFLLFCFVALWNVNIFFTSFGSLLIIVLLIHGWKSLEHVIKDYTFPPEIAKLFLFLTSAILLRLVLIVLGLV